MKIQTYEIVFILFYYLNVTDSPEVRFQTSPRWMTSSLEDSTSFMNLKCIADANPSAMIKWFKDSTPISSENVLLLTENRTESNSTSTVSELRFEPVKRDDAGLYSCKAVNIIGESPPANYALDVQCSYNFVLFFFYNFFEKK